MSIGEGALGVNFLGHTSKRAALGVDVKKQAIQKSVFNTETNRESIIFKNELESKERQLYSDKFGIGLNLLIFPWSKSGFYLGMTARYSDNRYAYEEQTIDFGLTQAVTTIDWVERGGSFALPVGYSSYLTSRCHFFGSAAPNWLVTVERTLIDDGMSNGVDQARRDEALHSFDTVRRRVSWEFTTGAGYAF
jgi:hypothetical protein